MSDCDYYSVGMEQDAEPQPQQRSPSSDLDKSCTMPRSSESYRHMFQSKRPVSTCLPSNPSPLVTPGVATIRRAPSTKPNLRRPSGLNLGGPIPIKTPMIPVKTPTVPEHAGNVARTPLSPPTTPLSPGRPVTTTQ